jgi:hypothetical protein
LAMSRPIVVTACILAPPNRGHFNSNHVLGTCVPVEEPSTASKPDIRDGWQLTTSQSHPPCWQTQAA